MRKSLMPRARSVECPGGIEWDVPPQALKRWSTDVVAAVNANAETINILDPIGVDFWTGEGVTAKRVAGALRAIGGKDVIVNINSPGGDLFEGLAIYNVLREHAGTVTVKVLGLAASAASVIAMAGDEIQIARSGFLMVHNTWILTMGNRHELRAVADTLEPFDVAMAELYAARTSLEMTAIQKKMDAETWINGSAAVAEGWADRLLPADEVGHDEGERTSRRGAELKARWRRTNDEAAAEDFLASLRSLSIGS